MNAVNDKSRVIDGPEIGKAGLSRLLPLTERRHLCGGDVRSRCRVEVVVSLGKPLDKRSARRLARRGWRKEDLLQHCVSLQGGITEVPGQTLLLQVHDVFATARRSPY